MYSRDLVKPCLHFVIPVYESLRIDKSYWLGGGCETFIKSEFQYRRFRIKSKLGCLAVEVVRVQ